MADIDSIIDRLLGDRRISEGAAFSGRSYSDQPLIERGSDFKARMAQRAQERAARRQHDAAMRRERAGRGGTREGRTSGEPYDVGLPYDLDLGSDASAGLRLGLDFDAPPRATTPWPATESVPERIREMRKLEGAGLPPSLAYGSMTVSSLFYQQARLMEDYEDDYEFHGDFAHYYPTYALMSDHQLRGYFSWRTRVRAGQIGPAPLSFAFVHVYELLCGVGTTSGPQGLRDLRSFMDGYRAAGEAQGARLGTYVTRWAKDYAVYHDIQDALGNGPADALNGAVVTLLRAEHAWLASQARAPKVPHADATGPAPAQEALFGALGAASSYHIAESRLAKGEPALVARVACDVFHQLVLHCSRRRKTDFVEGLFGFASRVPYTMFSAAVFHEGAPHPDDTVRVSDCETFVCRDGRWHRILACDAPGRSAELGRIMHAVDRELRRQLDYPYPLKERAVPLYVQRLVAGAVAACLEERREAERRRITIDLSKLGDIRAAAAVTQEALLTDEERGAQVAEGASASARERMGVVPAAAGADAHPGAGPGAGHGGMPPSEGAVPAASGTGGTSVSLAAPGAPSASSTPASPAAPPASSVPPAPVSPATGGTPAAPVSPSASVSPAAPPAGGDAREPDQGGTLSPLEARVIAGLVEGTPLSELLSPTDPFPSVVIDGINEKLFDLIGDAVIEFDGDEPHVIDDYLDDIREVLAP
ncbi:MAG: TerB N-terminal domain-containing protein [Acidobacteriota bacterium]|nr:TerB N-terminal domain-containing protein [Acidobacteriota bacterium]